MKPVIELAQRGFVVTEKQQAKLDHYDSIIRVVNGKDILFTENIKANDTIKNLQLAETLKRIASNGKDEFYKGKTAEQLISFF